MKYQIDPHNITNFTRDAVQLQTFLLFSIIVAGKNSKMQSEKLARFLFPAEIAKITPFKLIGILSQMGLLRHSLEFNKLGQYNRIEQAFSECIGLNLNTCTIADLENIKGIGPKTARFFVMHTRPNQMVAALDTHILRYIREELNYPAPKSTPSGKRYAELETVFVSHAFVLDKTPAELDLEIWSRYNKL